MKIVVAVHHFPPAYRGGAELWTQRLAHGLQARGWTVDVVCVEHLDRGPADAVAAQVETYGDLRVRRLQFDLGRAPDTWRWSYDNPWISTYLEDWWRSDRPDLVLLISGYLLGGSVLGTAERLGIPAVVKLTDYWFLCPRITLLRSDGSLSYLPIDPSRCARCLGEQSRRYRIPGRHFPRLMQQFWRIRRSATNRVRTRQEALRAALAGSRRVISESAFMCDLFAAAGLPAAKLVQVRQGTDAAFVPPAEPTHSPVLRVGYLGQIAELKGVHVLIDALRLAPDLPLRLDLFGDNQREPAYTAALRRRAGDDRRIHWRGLLTSPQATRDALYDLDVACVPSVWHENSPNAVLEAFATGVPVVASDIGGIGELVQHEHNGLLFEPGNAAALATQLKALAAAPELLKRLRAGIPPTRRMDEELDDFEAILRAAVGTGEVLRA